MKDIQELSSMIADFQKQCPPTAELHQYDDDDITFNEIDIPYSETQKYPICEIKIHEGKVQIWGANYHEGLLEKAKAYFGKYLRY